MSRSSAKRETSAVNRVPLDLHQFPSPISASIGAVTISKFGLSVDEAPSIERKTGKQSAEYLAPRVSELFLKSLPSLLSVPILSFWPLTKPSQWGVSILPPILTVLCVDHQVPSDSGSKRALNFSQWNYKCSH